MRRTASWLLCLGLGAGSAWSATGSGPDGVASFDCRGERGAQRCDVEGGWRFNDSSSSLSLGAPDHGVAPGRLRMQGAEFVPWAHTAMSAGSPFHGDLRGRGVSRLSFEAETHDFSGGFCDGSQLPFMSMTVELRNDRGTPMDEFDDCAVLTVLGPVPQIGEGVVGYTAAIPAGSEFIPTSFRISKLGDGCRGLSPDEAWRLVVQDTSQIRICWEECDFLRIQCDWSVSLDQVVIE